MTSSGQSNNKFIRMRTATIVVAAFACVCTARGQEPLLNPIPTISYIIPDIGAPGVAEVVEFIAPSSNSIGNFGTDGINPAGVIVQTGSPDIIPGPFVVSNLGRVLDAVIYVTTNADPKIQYSLNVKVNGLTTGTPQNFYIQNVQHLAALNGSQVFNVRSARGAMIIDNLSLSNGVFTLDMSDHDNTNLGNQAFLPATIYVLGKAIINSTATLSVSASSANGGPGGGGGGGRACDYTSSESPGGDGYTAGGGGGANVVGTPSTQYANSGTGTGPNGLSLNSTPPGGGGTSCATNGGAGGTGYPFGAGGATWCSGAAPQGNLGGGSDGTDGNGGGGGGYGTPGRNGDGANGGQLYGTPQVVPLCGGSGGAAGNPSTNPFSSGCSGDGGGGGGAILIFARDSIIVNGRIFANGGDGSNGDNVSLGGKTAGGGGGSGGAIVLQSNAGVFVNGTLQAIGGRGGTANPGGTGGAGGDGRIRIDNANIAPAAVLTPLPSTVFNGISLDTIAPTHKTSVSVGGTLTTCTASTAVHIYVQRGDGTFETDPANPGNNFFVPTISNCTFQTTVPLDITNGNTTFYISAVRIETTPASNTVSNAAAITVQYLKPDCPTSSLAAINFGTVFPCKNIDFISINDKLYSKDDSMQLTLALNKTNIFTGFPRIIAAGDTIIQPIQFNPPPNTIYDTIFDTLIISDPANPTACPPIRIPLMGIMHHYDAEFKADTLDFKNTLQGQYNSYSITNYGDSPIIIDSLIWNPPDSRFSVIIPTTFPDTILASQKLDLQIRFQATSIADTNAYVGILQVYRRDSICHDFESIPAFATTLAPIAHVTPAALDFGTLTSCGDSLLSFTLKNTGNSKLHIDSLRFIDTSALSMSFTLAAHAEPDSLLAGASTTYSITFTPKAPDGIKKTKLLIFSNSYTGVDTITLTARRISAAVAVQAVPLDLGSVNVGATRSDTLFLRDTGTAKLCVHLNQIKAPFTMAGATDTTLNPGDTLKVVITFAPGATDTGQFLQKLSIYSNCPCADSAFVTLKARAANGVPSYTSLAFGIQSNCAIRFDSIPIWNAGNAPITLDSFPSIIGPDAKLFSLVNPPIGKVLSPGDTTWLVVEYNALAGTDGTKSASIVMLTSFNGKQDSSLIALGAVRITQQATGPVNVAFSTILAGTQQTTLALIINTGSAPIVISSVITVPATEFQVQVISPPLAATLKIGDTMKVRVTFSPTASDTDSTKIIHANLVALTGDTCGNDSVIVPLTGRAYNIRPLAVRLCFGAAQNAPIGSLVQIPISVDTTVSITDSLAATISVTYDPMVLHILSATSACGAVQLSYPTRNTLTLTLPHCTGTILPGTIAILNCEVLIGPHNVATMSIDSVNYSSAAIQSIHCSQNLIFTAGAVCAGALAGATGLNSLAQSSPNPITAANPVATIEYESVADTRFVLRVWDMFGREIAHVVDGYLQHGRYTSTFDTRGLPNGTYYYSFDAGIFHAAKRMVILR